MKLYAFADEASPEIDSQLLALQQNGLDGLEIRNVDGVNIADITEEKAREVRAKMDAAGLKVWSVGSPIGKISLCDAAAHVEKFKKVLKFAKILGAENIRLFSLHIPEGTQPDDCTGEVIAFLKELAALAQGSGVTLCHENEKGIYGDTPQRCLKLHQSVPELKAIFDPANYVQCGVDTVQAWEMLKPYVKYLHIKDALPDGNVVPAGKGVGELPYILGDYRARGGNAVTLEPHLHVFEGLSALENEGEKSVVGALYAYPSSEAAFQAAADALKALL